MVLAAVVAVALAALAQESGSSGTQSKTSPGKAEQPAQEKPPTDEASETFSAAIADALMSRLAQGLVRRNPRMFLSAFEPGRMTEYGLFAERVSATFEQNESFRVYYHVLEAAQQEGRGKARVEVQLERTSRNSGAVPVRKRGQVRIECGRGAKGWRIVELSPRDFFTQP